MASKSVSFKNSLLLHIFQNADIANIGDAGGLQNSTADGSLYVSLHTADPRAGGGSAQNTTELSYAGATPYARVAVSRTGATGWTVAANVVSNTAAITFPNYSAGASQTALFWGVGTASSGAGVLLYSGPISSFPVGVFEAEESDERISIKNHSLALDDRIVLYQLSNLSVGTGISAFTVYYVGTIVDVDTITLSTTPANANPAAITVDGQGLAYKVLPFTVSAGVTPSFAIGSFQIDEN
jgi:hypothetical protein